MFTNFKRKPKKVIWMLIYRLHKNKKDVQWKRNPSIYQFASLYTCLLPTYQEINKHLFKSFNRNVLITTYSPTPKGHRLKFGEKLCLFIRKLLSSEGTTTFLVRRTQVANMKWRFLFISGCTDGILSRNRQKYLYWE